MLGAGEMLIAEGQLLDDLIFVVEGALCVTTAGAPINALGVGDVVGEMSFVEKLVPTAAITATEPSRVLCVPRARILDAFSSDTGFAARSYRALAVFLSDRLRRATGQWAPELQEDEMRAHRLLVAAERFVRLLDLPERQRG